MSSSNARASHPEPVTEAPAPADHLRVLLVEDSATARVSVCELLRRTHPGIAIDEEADVAGGLRALTDQRYDCALLDYRLPDGDGLTLLGRLEATGTSQTPIVVLTALNDEATAVRALQNGAQDYLIKGRFDGPTLLRSIRYAIERKRAAVLQLRMVHMERMVALGTLSAGVAHEINNPLAYVLANLNCMGERLPDLVERVRNPVEVARIVAELQEFAEMVRDARTGAERVRDIVRDMRAFARRDDHDLRAAVCVEGVLEQSIGMAWNELRHRALLVRSFEKTPPVLANETRLGQVFLNILINAVQAIPEGRAAEHRIRVATRASGAHVEVRIEDDGIGIPPKDLQRVFHPFYTTKPVGAGTGLGLFICDGIVRGFGGTISIESTPGKGTVVCVRLPAHAAAAAAPPVPAPGRRSEQGKRARVLVVDDDALVLLSIRRLLDEEHDLVTTTSAYEALRRVREGERFDLIVADLMMPEMTGMALHEELAVLSPALAQRMLFITGGAFTPSAQEFLQTVRNDRLEKPFDAQELRDLVNKLV